MGFFKMGDKLGDIHELPPGSIMVRLERAANAGAKSLPADRPATSFQCRRSSSNPELFCALPKDHGGQCGGDLRDQFTTRQPGEKT